MPCKTYDSLVISPLLANIYLNVLDTLWKVKKVQEKLGARLVRYADDVVILYEGNTDRIRLGYKAYPDSYYHNVRGLYQVPVTAPWTRSAKATGRR